MEVAGVVLGVVPIVVEVIKAWKTVGGKLRVFRHYSKEIRRIYDRLRVQHCIFESELDLLISQARRDHTAINAVSLYDLKPLCQVGKDLDADIAAFLGKDGESYTGLIHSLSEQLDTLKSELKSFDQLAAQKQEVRWSP